MTQAEQLAAQAAQWQAAGRPDMAVQLYTAALDQDPAKFQIRTQLADCLVHLQQPDTAAEQYLMVAQAYAARGRAAECIAVCERIIQVSPQSFVYMSVGPMIRRIGRHARPLCAKAAELHLSAGRQTDGLQMLRLGAELDPHNPEVRRQLARIYLARHMKREAVEALCDASNLLLQAKRHQDFVEVANQILELEPRDVNTLRELPRVYLELHKPHQAVRALGQLTKVSPGDIAGYEILAQAFALIGRTDKALGVLERLVEELGATGQADKADSILNHARYWRPSDTGFLRSLKRVEIPRPRPASTESPPPPSAEGTVVLSIADLMVEPSRSAKNPGHEDSSVRLVEAEGTVTLDLDELMIDEMAQMASMGLRPPPPPPAARASSAPAEPVDATITLDGNALADALVGLETGGARRPDAVDEAAATVPPASEPSPPDLVGSPKSASHLTANPNSISALVYDDDDDDAEPATLLHMKALTAEDIARAQRAQATEPAPPAALDLDAPTLAPGTAPSRPAVDLDAPTVAPPGRVRPAADPQRLDEPHATTLGPADGFERDIDGPTLGPSGPDSTFGGGEDGPTHARLSPLTAADIARALSKGGPQTPAHVPSPSQPPSPQPPSMVAVGDDDETRPPPGSAPARAAEPEQPPLLDSDPHALPNDEDQMTRVHMQALTPADIARALRKSNDEDEST
ncbi:MAG: tetratricopeptide repeat protein [Nannocystaceae bacterium]